MAAEKRLTRAALRQRVRAMARDIADGLVELLERHGRWDEAAPAPVEEPGPKRVRRSEAALEEVCAEVIDLLRRAKEPLAISAIADALGLGRREVAHPLSLLVEEGKLLRSGTRRGTRYSLAGRRTLAPPRTGRPPRTQRPPRTVRPPKTLRSSKKKERKRSTRRKR